MKVLITADQLRRPVPGGIGTYIRGLQLGLGAVSTVSPTLWTGSFPPGLQVRLWDMGLVRPPKGHDVVHATSLAVPPRSATPMTVMVHDLAWQIYPEAYPARGRSWHEAALGRARQRAERFATPSPDVAQQLVASGVSADKVRIIGLGCDHLPEPDIAGAKSRLVSHGISGEFLLSVGTLEPRKNLVRLVEAYQRIRSELPEPWPLAIVGPTGWGDQLAPVEGVVFIQGASDAEVAAFYQLCRVLAYVPLLEGFGFPAIEAMQMGAPVVTSPVPSVGNAGLQIDPNDVASIADGLLRAASDDALRADLVEQGMKQAQTMTWEACAKAHVEMWNSLL